MRCLLSRGSQVRDLPGALTAAPTEVKSEASTRRPTTHCGQYHLIVAIQMSASLGPREM
jgi:hypothetical protein